MIMVRNVLRLVLRIRRVLYWTRRNRGIPARTATRLTELLSEIAGRGAKCEANLPELERRFHGAMVELHQRAKAECGYVATRFIQMVTELGGVEAAERLILAREPSDGFTVLWEKGRLDLTVEAISLRDEFRPLFSEEQLAIARQRLSDYGYVASEGDA